MFRDITKNVSIIDSGTVVNKYKNSFRFQHKIQPINCFHQMEALFGLTQENLDLTFTTEWKLSYWMCRSLFSKSSREREKRERKKTLLLLLLLLSFLFHPSWDKSCFSALEFYEHFHSHWLRASSVNGRFSSCILCGRHQNMLCPTAHGSWRNVH